MPQAGLVSTVWVRNASVTLTLDLSLLTSKPALSCLMLSRNGAEQFGLESHNPLKNV